MCTGPVAAVLMGVLFVALLIGTVVKVILMTLRSRGEPGPAPELADTTSAQAAELEDRVQLDRVRRDPGLAMLEIEERNPDDHRSHGWRTGRPRATVGVPPTVQHLHPLRQFRPADAGR